MQLVAEAPPYLQMECTHCKPAAAATAGRHRSQAAACKRPNTWLLRCCTPPGHLLLLSWDQAAPSDPLLRPTPPLAPAVTADPPSPPPLSPPVLLLLRQPLHPLLQHAPSSAPVTRSSSSTPVVLTRPTITSSSAAASTRPCPPPPTRAWLLRACQGACKGPEQVRSQGPGCCVCLNACVQVSPQCL